MSSNNCSSSKRRRADPKTSYLSAAIEVCDTLDSQLTDRFENSKLVASFCIVDPKRFPNFATNFPEAYVNILNSHFTFIEKSKLVTELRVLFLNESFRGESVQSVSSLFQYVVEHGLSSTFPEVVKVLQIVLSTPVSSAEPERCFSTLKRIKTLLRNCMGQSRLNSLAVLSIHKEDIEKDDQFNKKVIERFASMKNRRANFLYK